jgi:putative DNA primase/helicase
MTMMQPLKVQVVPPPEPPARLKTVTAAELMTLNIPPREMVLGPVLPEKGLMMLYSKRGTGKTFLGMSMAYAIATGGKFLMWSAPKPRRTLYVDGEMPANALKERMAAIAAGSQGEMPDDGYFRFLAADLQEVGMPDVATAEGQARIEQEMDDAEVLILDNLSTLATGKENEGDEWLPVQSWLLSLRRRGVAVVLIHHAAKGGQQRGTSRREDILDTTVALRHPEDYNPTEGARFEVHLEKARGIHGDEAAPFEAALAYRDGAAVWTTRTLEDATMLRVITLTNEGLSAREIATEIDTSKSRVNRLQAKARELGKLGPARAGGADD